MRPAGTQLYGNTLVVRSEAPLVGHSQWMAKAISEAKSQGLGVALVTPDTTKITRSLAHLFSVLGIMWVVDDGRDELFVGQSGQRVDEVDGEYIGRDEIVPRYSRKGSAQDRGGVVVMAESLMPRRFTTRVGPLAEAVTRALTGNVPIGWGVQEPVTQPWSVEDISAAYSRDKAAGHFLHFVGPVAETSGQDTSRLAGTLEIQKPHNGVVEHVEAACPQPGPWTKEQKLDFARQMHGQSVRWATAYQTVGSDPTVVPPFYLGQPVPAVAVYGREALKGQDLDQVVELAMSRGAEHCEVFGHKKKASLAVFMSSDADPDRTHPAEILETVQMRLMGSQAPRP